jgi:hypothetical protein
MASVNLTPESVISWAFCTVAGALFLASVCGLLAIMLFGDT